MIRKFTTLLAAVVLGFSAAWSINPVIPAPQSVTPGNGTFTFEKGETIVIPASEGDSVAMAFDVMRRSLNAAAGVRITPADKGRITLQRNESLGAEAYTLDVTPDAITIGASTPKGFLYGMQTLLQLLPVATKEPATVESVAIVDEPRFAWRGFMLDEGRHFFGKETVKRVIDAMSLYKMNRFHWHLTEDQGWRLVIPGYEKLTDISATRNCNRLGIGNSREADNETYGPFYYTPDDIREIVDYAAKRHIDIVPEVDLPGHIQAVLAAYPELACRPDSTYTVWRNAGVSRDVLNVANDKAVKFTTDVVDELLELFPFGYIHLGGDECPTDEWKRNADCIALLESIGSDNFSDLQTNYYRQVNDHIKKQSADKQRKLIFWNEVLEGNTDMIGADDITIMSWVDWEKAAREAARRGFDVVMTPYIPYYINRKENADVNYPNVAGAGTETLEAVYAYEPLETVTENADKYIGVQANFWTEWVDSESLLQYLMLPRLAAVAERGWSTRDTRDYTNLVERLNQWHTPHYISRGWNYGRSSVK